MLHALRSSIKRALRRHIRDSCIHACAHAEVEFSVAPLNAGGPGHALIACMVRNVHARDEQHVHAKAAQHEHASTCMHRSSTVRINQNRAAAINSGNTPCDCRAAAAELDFLRQPAPVEAPAGRGCGGGGTRGVAPFACSNQHRAAETAPHLFTGPRPPAKLRGGVQRTTHLSLCQNGAFQGRGYRPEHQQNSASERHKDTHEESLPTESCGGILPRH